MNGYYTLYGQKYSNIILFPIPLVLKLVYGSMNGIESNYSYYDFSFELPYTVETGFS